MPKDRIKLLIWLGLVIATLVLVLGVVVWLGRVVVFFGTGADRGQALNVIPAVPADLAERVTWLPDHADAATGRALDPVARAQIAGGYLAAWAQLNVSHELGAPYGLKTYFSGQALAQAEQAVADVAAAGMPLRQSNLHHTLELTFFSDDGSIAAFTDHDARFVRFLPDAATVLETRAAYDVVMLLEDGNWRVRYFVRRGDGRDVASAAPVGENADATTAFITTSGPYLWRDGARMLVAGVNYYPRATPWQAFWREYDPARTAADLQTVRTLGLNTVRIFVPFSDFGGGTVDPAMVAQLTDFLDQAQAHGIAVIVTLFDHRTDHSPANWAADDRHIAGIVPALAAHPALLAWDLKNEPDRDYDLNGVPLTQAWLRHVAARVRAHDPNHLLTIGWSSPEAAVALADAVDVVAYHYFAPAVAYSARVGALRDAVGPKPLLLEEFGLPTWNSIFPHGHTEAEQAAYYAEMLAQQRALDTAGYLAWTLYDFVNMPWREFLLPWERGPQAHMGLIRRDDSLKPAARLVAPDAALDAAPVAAWRRFVKPFWLVLYAVAILGAGIVAFTRFFRRNSQGSE